MADIKKTINDLISFDIENDYYDKENKSKLVDMFKDILFEDDVVIRKFLKKLFSSIGILAKEFDLVGDEDDETSEPEEEPTEIETPEEEPESEEEPEVEEESYTFTESENINIQIANYLID